MLSAKIKCTGLSTSGTFFFCKMMLKTPKQLTGILKTTKTKPFAKKNNSEDSRKFGAWKNNSKKRSLILLMDSVWY